MGSCDKSSGWSWYTFNERIKDSSGYREGAKRIMTLSVARVHAWLRKDVSCNCLKSISARTISDENRSHHILFISDWLRHSSVMCGLSLQVRRKLNIHFLSPQQGFPHVTAAAEAEPGCGQGPVCWASSKVTSWIRLCRWGKRRDSQLGVSARLQGDSKPTVKTRHFQARSEANKQTARKNFCWMTVMALMTLQFLAVLELNQVKCLYCFV